MTYIILFSDVEEFDLKCGYGSDYLILSCCTKLYLPCCWFYVRYIDVQWCATHNGYDEYNFSFCTVTN